MAKIDEIENYFKSNEAWKATTNQKIDACTTIIDPVKFVRTSIGYLRGNPKKERFMPYYTRLYQFYLLCRKTQ